MKIEDQVVNLELSKKLKELGIKQDSLFYYMHPKLSSYAFEKNGTLIYGLEAIGKGFVLGRLGKIGSVNCNKTYSAFTVAELGEKLPGGFNNLRIDTYRGVKHKRWLCQSHNRKHIFEDKTEVSARAKMLIYLKENNLLEK